MVFKNLSFWAPFSLFFSIPFWTPLSMRLLTLLDHPRCRPSLPKVDFGAFLGPRWGSKWALGATKGGQKGPRRLVVNSTGRVLFWVIFGTLFWRSLLALPVTPRCPKVPILIDLGTLLGDVWFDFRRMISLWEVFCSIWEVFWSDLNLPIYVYVVSSLLLGLAECAARLNKSCLLLNCLFDLQIVIFKF